jgi:hypothetical protein
MGESPIFVEIDLVFAKVKLRKQLSVEVCGDAVFPNSDDQSQLDRA